MEIIDSFMNQRTRMEAPQLSIVIPIYNGALTLGTVVQRIEDTLREYSYEVVLVNDGSTDDSETVAANLTKRLPNSIHYVHLSRNFGEHHAVLAGIARARGSFVAIMDDDGQNPPEEIPRMLAVMIQQNLDVVYGRYHERKHSWSRRCGSWFNDRVATLMLKKPKGLYLSSFKIMNRFVADQLVTYYGPYPYIDGLICRITNRLGQLDVRHEERLLGTSNYTLRKLVRLWLNMFLGFSILPLRLSVFLGFFTAMLSGIWLLLILIDKLWITPNLTIGIPTVLASIVLFAGIQLIVLGTIGEYVGRIFLAENGQPQYVVRYSTCGGSRDA